MDVNFVFKIWSTFNPKERKKFILLISSIVIHSILQALGVVSILPFIYVLSNPNLIAENEILISLKEFFYIQNNQNILLLLAFFSFISLSVANLFALFVLYYTEIFYNLHGGRISHTLFDTYLKQNYIFFLKYDSTQLLKNTTEEIDRYIGGVMLPLIKIFNKFCLLTFCILIMFYASIKITIYTLALFIPAYTLIYLIFKKGLGKAGAEVENAIMLRHKLINLALRAIKEVKLFNSENYWSKKYFKQSHRRAKHVMKNKIIGNSPQYFFETFAYGGVLLILSIFISTDSNTQFIPALTLFAFASYKIAPAISQIYSSYVKATFHKDAFLNLYNHLNLKDKSLKNENKNLINTSNNNLLFQSELEIKNLTFGYNIKNQTIFENLNLKIKKNENIGIIGESGIGKTTLIDILLGLIQNYNGSILVDNKEINQSNLQLWQNKIGYVPQFTYLTDESLKKNIAFSIDENLIDEKRVKECIELAELKSIIEFNDLETEFGDAGSRLSGGQKQRIAIARALYKNPEILVFDEATNALDIETSDKIINSIKKISTDKTIIFISHDRKNLNFCDKIYTIKNKKLQIFDDE